MQAYYKNVFEPTQKQQELDDQFIELVKLEAETNRHKHIQDLADECKISYHDAEEMLADFINRYK